MPGRGPRHVRTLARRRRAAIVHRVSPRALAALALLAAACAPRFDPRLVDVPIAGRRWISAVQTGHPLVGKIWVPASRAFVDEAALTAAVTSADFVALGEVHDNPDHHLLQARLVRAITASGRRPALAFEMLDGNRQEAVDAAPKDPDAVAKAVDWNHSGWPEFQLYRPIFAAGLEAGLPIVAANLSRPELKEIRSKGRQALDASLEVRLAREEPFSDSARAGLKREMEEAHCGEVPESRLEALVLVQRARDARMAERMAAAGAERGAILISGKGHARNDRAVPAIVAKDAPGKKVVAVAFAEVDKDELDPASYGEGAEGHPAPYDFLVFTPAADRDDPCESMRKQMEKKRAAAPQDAPQPPAADAAKDASAPGKPEAAPPVR
jgi:uncharacterized iron-regulated protein